MWLPEGIVKKSGMNGGIDVCVICFKRMRIDKMYLETLAVLYSLH